MSELSELIRQMNRMQQEIDSLVKPEVGTAGSTVWTDWTPTVTQSGSVTITVDYARYTKIDDTAIVLAR